MPPSTTLSPLAHTKIILHAARYPEHIVNGVLVGKIGQDGAVDVVDAIPLLHNWTSLSPMMEVALELAASHASALSLALVGYYQADESLSTPAALSPTGQALAARFAKSTAPHNPSILLLSPADLADPESPALVALDSKSHAPSASHPVSTPNPALTRDALRAGVHERLGDFDEHLEDVRVDWLGNKGVGEWVKGREATW